MNTDAQGVWNIDTLKPLIGKDGHQYHTFFENAAMLVEYLEYPAGHIDPQQPHEWDELYYIISGQSEFTADGVTRSIKAGDNIFVAAHIVHKFHNITEDLSVIVFFSKQEPVK